MSVGMVEPGRFGAHAVGKLDDGMVGCRRALDEGASRKEGDGQIGRKCGPSDNSLFAMAGHINRTIREPA